MPAFSTTNQGTIAKLLIEGVSLHKNGHLPETELIYRRIVAIDPGHDGALHLLGLLAHSAVRRAELSMLLSAKP